VRQCDYDVKLPFIHLAFFYNHVLELAGIEDFSAFQAFDEFRVFFASYDAHARMLALRRVAAFFGRLGRTGRSHGRTEWNHRFRLGRSGSESPSTLRSWNWRYS